MADKKTLRRSVATIDSPEFINLTPRNDLISQCEIKVLYLGENRNGSFIDKETAAEMANTLPGVPIVGAFREDIQDFGDHGHVMTIEDGEVKFSCKTRPYGFVAPDAKAWFQKFIDTDEFGNEFEREYLMTTGYLWTGQYEEAMSIVENGKSQSMELDPDTLDGHWATNAKTGMEFFIINDAVFSKLCILGDSTEPCFEGASITAPNVSKSFSQDPDFTNTLFAMMNELKEALIGKGGLNMPSEEMNAVSEFAEDIRKIDENNEDDYVAPEPEEQSDSGEVVESSVEVESVSEGDSSVEVEDVAETEASESDVETEMSLADSGVSQEQYNAVVAENEAMKAELAELREFKLAVENKEKDAVIAKYFMVSDSVREEISAHKSEYSIGDIEAKLALAYVNENVDFSMDAGERDSENEDPSTVFSLDSEIDGAGASGLISALRAVAKSC